MGHSEVGQLTRREREVAALLADGLSNKEIANRLFISVRTAEFHVDHVRGKLGLQSRAQVASRMASAAKERQPAPAPSLPAHLTSFIGREWEAAMLGALLERSRLVTVTGPGGIGKTRLALEVAPVLEPPPPDGAWLVEFAPVTDPGLVVTVISATLGLREDPARPGEETLLATLRQRQLLLLLDNCEHLVERVATVVRRILSGCPGVRVLATSRAPLGVAGEALLPLEGLGLPGVTGATVELAASDAVRLFLGRAQLVRPGFEPTPAELKDIAGLCQALEGMPLAIELAAARLSGMTAAEIRGRIVHGQAVLATSSRAVPERHRTLEAAIGWSYSLLDSDERSTLQRLSVCAGFDLEAAEAVCAAPGLSPERVAEFLLGLVEKSLVSAHPAGATTRYRLLEPLRQYASWRLSEAEEAAGTRRRHARHFAAIGERLMPDVLGVRPANWVRSIERDLDNFRIALGWAAEHDADLELRLVTRLRQFWFVRQRLDEWEAAITHAVSVATAPSRARVHGLGAKAWIRIIRGNFEDGRRLGTEALSLARQLGLRKEEAWAMYTVGCAEVGISAEDAEATLEQARSLARKVGDPWLLARTLLSGPALSSRPEMRRANLAEALALVRQTGDIVGTLIAVVARGVTAFAEQDDRLAADSWREGLGIAHELGDRNQLQELLEGLAQLAIKHGDVERGLRLAGAAAGIRSATNAIAWFTAYPHLGEWLAQAREALPTEAADRAWAEGTRMNDDEAIYYALGDP
jgi:predicted ATPase/DNA-binding CsgD family transcriptional regulator